MDDQEPRIKLKLFGPPKVKANSQVIDISNRKAMALLAYLAVEEGAHNRFLLEKLLWPDYSETRASANLRRAFWVLSQTPIAELIEEDDVNIRLRPSQSLSVDVLQFREDLASLGSEAVLTKKASDLKAATDLYQGDFLEGLALPDASEFERWTARRREELQTQVLDTLDRLIAFSIKAEEYRNAQTLGWRALEINRLRESSVQGLMFALNKDGQPAAALAQYENLRQSLELEFDAKPSAQIRELYEQIRAEASDHEPHAPSHHISDPDEPISMPIFLFTDIENSTPLWDRHREAMLHALLQHNAILKEKIEKYGGRIEETRGDGVRAVFDAGQPLEAALEIQQAFGQADWGKLNELRIRVGLYGISADWEGYDYFREDGTVFGPALNYAARVMDAAWGGQILVSESVSDALPLPRNASWQDFGIHELKGCEEPAHILGLHHPSLPHQNFPPIRTLTTEGATDVKAEENGKRRSSPYLGLYAFQEQDAPYFFGREAFTELLIERVHHQPMVAVVGPSGSGKSSVVHAGLLPQLRAQREWLITQFRPGSRPFHALAASLIKDLEPNGSKTDLLVETNKLAEGLRQRDLSLMDIIQDILDGRSSATRMQLVGDQFEELYTLVPDTQLRNSFMDVLTDAVFDQQYRPNPLFSLTLTLRADFLSQALAHRPFADAIQESDVKLGPMTRSELSRAIEKPAEKADASFEAGLIPRILDDVGDEPGNLPLLEFALAMMWEQIDGVVLTHEAYDSIDRVEGALAKHADSVFKELDDADQAVARRIFVQVVRPGEGTEDTRRLATRSELGEANWGLVQRLADSRLLVTGLDSEGNETVEVVHEALIRGWGRLREWMQADREFRLWQERTRVLVRQWESSDRDAGALLRGLPLASAERWIEERREDLSEAEIEFIQASISERQIREEAEKAQQERERSLERAALRRLRVIVGVLVAAAIAGSALTVSIFNQSRIAQRRADEIQSLSLTRAADQALENHNPELALALAMKANSIDEPPSGALQTIRKVAFVPGVARGIQAHDAPIVDIHLSPDGRLLATATGRFDLVDEVMEDNSIALWDTATGELVRRLVGHEDRPTHLDFSHDQQYLVSSGLDGWFILWDLATGEEMRRIKSELTIPVDAHFVQAGSSSEPTVLIRSVTPNEDVLDPFDPTFVAEMVVGVWDLQSGEARFPFELDTADLKMKSAQYSRDHPLLVAGFNSKVGSEADSSYEGRETLVAWDIASGQVVDHIEIDMPGLWATRIEISPDGSGAIFGMEGRPQGALILWDIGSGEYKSRDYGAGVMVHHFSPDGESAFVESIQGIEKVDAQDGTKLLSLGESAFYLDFSDDGSRMMSFGPMILWDPDTGEPLARFDSTDEVLVGKLSHDGKKAFTGHPNGMLRIWDLGSGTGYGSAVEAQLLRGHEDQVTSAAFSPDGRWAISGGGQLQELNNPSADNSLILWEVETGELLRRFEGHAGPIWSVAFSPDGQFIASGAQDRSVILWELESGREIRRWEDLAETVMALTFTPDGSSLLAGLGSPWNPEGEGTGLTLLDLETGSQIWQSSAANGSGSPQIWSIAIHPENQEVLTGSNRGNLDIWDLESGEKLRSIELPEEYSQPPAFEGLVFTADGSSFVTSDFVGLVQLWDYQTGQVIRAYPHDADTSAHRIDISPDGSKIIAAFGLPGSVGESTKAVILWDLETGEELQRFEGHTEWVRDAQFSPSGSNVISASGDGTVRIWDLVGGNIFSWIEENRYVRELTTEELEQFGLESKVD